MGYFVLNWLGKTQYKNFLLIIINIELIQKNCGIKNQNMCR